MKLSKRLGDGRFGYIRVGLSREWFWIGARYDFARDGWWYNVFGVTAFIGAEYWGEWKSWIRKKITRSGRARS